MSKSSTTKNPATHRKPRRQADPKLVQEARDFWRFQVIDPTSPMPVEEAVGMFMARYAGAWKPSAFDNSGDRQAYRAAELLGGSRRLEPDDRAGNLGALVVALEGKAVHTVLHLEDLGLELPDDAVDDPHAADLVARAVQEVITGPFVLWLERGEGFGRRWHVHLLHADGACLVGWSSEPLSGQELFKMVKYVSKKPRPSRESMTSYARAVREYGYAARRFRVAGVGRARPALAEVEAALGLSLRRPARALTRFGEVETEATAQLGGTLVTMELGSPSSERNSYQVTVRDNLDAQQKIGALEASGNPALEQVAAHLSLKYLSDKRHDALNKIRRSNDLSLDDLARHFVVPRHLLADLEHPKKGASA